MSDTKPSTEIQAPSTAEVLLRAMWPNEPTVLAHGVSWAVESVNRLLEAGYVIVPLEPTEVMVKSGAELHTAKYHPLSAHLAEDDAASVWRAMVGAAR